MGRLLGAQNPHDLKIICHSDMVLLSARLTGPSLASGGASPDQGGESLFIFNDQFIQGKSFLLPPLVFLKQRVAGDQGWSSGQFLQCS